MSNSDFISLAPIIILAIAPVIVMLTIAFSRNLKVIYGFSLIASVIALLSLLLVIPVIPHEIKPLFIIDGFSILFLAVIILTNLVITVLSYIYLKRHKLRREEFFIILFIATLGSSLLVISNHFISLLLGLETLTVSLYILVTYIKSRDYSIEAGIKYLVIASVSTAFLLFGMALIYSATGSMSFSGLERSFNETGKLSPVLIIGFCFFLAGIGFKLAIVPFHMWVPDVYQGAPAPVAAYIATISKGAVFAVLIRFFNEINGFQNNTLVIVISVIAVFSMFTGNLLALNQANLKRLLGYSSISHLGYLLITLLTGNNTGINASVFYICTYIIALLGAFGVISLLSVCEGDAENIKFYKGLFWKSPTVAIVFTLTLLSLAGIPLTAGFLGKFYIVLAAFKSKLWILILSLVINSIISLYFYLKIITTMFSLNYNETVPSISITGKIVLSLISLGILFIGILPFWLTEIINIFLK
jgi:NADH-quinone oxidoreductase subunit N